KKKASKKKASKKKASKKKASKKKRSKKKRSKKKRSKKKASRKAAEGSWDRLVQALDDARNAAIELAESEAEHGRRIVDEVVGAIRSKF
ncbi:MAG: hypothetical protein WD397_01425, partial [Wenzhouxiangellaceae bacterium]